MAGGETTKHDPLQGDERLHLAITFDDGPHPELTPRILDLLDELEFRATFFVIGENAARCPQLVRRIVADGHALGNHTYTHPDPKSVTKQHYLHDVYRSQMVLEHITGTACDLFRPPYGRLTVGIACGLWTMRNTIVLWNVDPRDYQVRSADSMIEWCRGYSPIQGDTILLHDNTPMSATALQGLKDTAHGRMITSVPVTHWINGGTNTCRRLPQCDPQTVACLRGDTSLPSACGRIVS